MFDVTLVGALMAFSHIRGDVSSKQAINQYTSWVNGVLNDLLFCIVAVTIVLESDTEIGSVSVFAIRIWDGLC